MRSRYTLSASGLSIGYENFFSTKKTFS